MIARDEAKNLPACLASVRGVVDEIIVCDTGSVDDTVAIAQAAGARVVHFPWVNDFSAARNGKPTVPIGIFLKPGANALEVGNAVRARMAELEKSFPAGLQWSIPYDTTVYVKVSIIEVVKTLAEALFAYYHQQLDALL